MRVPWPELLVVLKCLGLIGAGYAFRWLNDQRALREVERRATSVFLTVDERFGETLDAFRQSLRTDHAAVVVSNVGGLCRDLRAELATARMEIKDAIGRVERERDEARRARMITTERFDDLHKQVILNRETAEAMEQRITDLLSALGN